MSLAERGPVPDPRPQLEAAVSDGELTLFEAEAEGFELMGRWVTAPEHAVISLEEMQ